MGKKAGEEELMNVMQTLSRQRQGTAQRSPLPPPFTSGPKKTHRVTTKNYQKSRSLSTLGILRSPSEWKCKNWQVASSHVVAAIRHRPSEVPHLNENGRTGCIGIARTCSSTKCRFGAEIYVPKYVCVVYTEGNLEREWGVGCQSRPSFLHQQLGATQKFGQRQNLLATKCWQMA